MLKNYVEDIVDETLKSLLPKYDPICQCEKCIQDIKALTLNELKPKYVVTDEGEVYAKLNELNYQFRTDIITKLMHAIDMVSKNPRH